MWWRGRRSPSHRDADDFAEEVRAHIALEEAQLRDEGLSPDDARREARRAFGNATSQIERTREASQWRWLDALRQDVGYGVRLMRRNPGFASTALLVLGLGIGVNSALFSIVNAVFFRPLQVAGHRRRDPCTDRAVLRGAAGRIVVPAQSPSRRPNVTQNR
jgi:hypothetical protein